jgi:hypothetical protein
LWAPAGPEFGPFQIRLDGEPAVEIRPAGHAGPSQPVWSSPDLTDGPHVLMMQAGGGPMPVDSLEVDFQQ